MKNGQKISTKGLSEGSLKKAIQAWNSSVTSMNNVNKSLKENKTALNTNTKEQARAKQRVQEAAENRANIRAGMSDEEVTAYSTSIRKPWYMAANEYIDNSVEQSKKKVDTTTASYEEQKKVTQQFKEQSDNAKKTLLTQKDLTDEQKKQIRNGQKLDINDNMSAETARLAMLYNLYFEALEKQDELEQELINSEIEYAQAMMDAIDQRYQNIEDYYNDLMTWNDTLRKDMESTNEIVTKTGRAYNTNQRLNIARRDSIAYLQSNILIAQQARNALQEELNKDVESGDVIVGDKKWHEYMEAIYDYGTQINETRLQIINLYEEMANVPVESATAQIDVIEERMKRISTFANQGLDSSIQLQRTYYQVSRDNFKKLVNEAKKAYGTNSKIYQELYNLQQQNIDETRTFAGGENNKSFAKTFRGQNDYLEKELQKLKDIMEIRRKAVIETQQNLNDINNTASGENSLNAWRNNLLGTRNKDAYGDLISALKKNKINGTSYYKIIKEYLDNNTTIDTNGETIQAIINSNKLSEEQRKQLSYLISHYNNAQTNYDVHEAEVMAAETANEQALTDFYNAQAEYVKAKAELVTNQLNNINSYMEVLYTRSKTYADTFQSMREELQEIGWDSREIGGLSQQKLYSQLENYYNKQIETLSGSYLEHLRDSISEQKKLLAESTASGAIIKDSEEWKEAWNQINNLEDQVRTTVQEIDKLYHEMQENVIFKPIKDAIEDIKKLRSSLDSVLDLISDDMKLTKDGAYTELGLASFAGQLNNYQSALEEISKTLEYQQKLTDEYNKQETITTYTSDENGNEKEIKRLKYTTEEYKDAMEEAQQKTQDALKNAQSYRTQIISAITSRYKTEIEYINELIDKRKEALQKQKEMNDYDKSLKNKTQEIQKIQQQIRALETLSDVESKAQKKRLEAQLQDQQEELDDAIQEHVYELRTEGLDEVKKELQDNYEKFSKDLALNIDSIIKTINDSASNIESVIDASNRTLAYYLGTFNDNLDVGKIGAEEFSSSNTTAFRNDTTHQSNADALEHYSDNYSYNEYNNLQNERRQLASDKAIESDLYGSIKDIASAEQEYLYSLSAVQDTSLRLMDRIDEASKTIITSDGSVLTPIEYSDNMQSFVDSLAIAKTNMNALSGIPMTSPINGYEKQSNITNKSVSNSGNTINVQSLITVNGDVDRDVMNDLQSVATSLLSNQNFMNATYDYISKENAKESRKRMY